MTSSVYMYILAVTVMQRLERLLGSLMHASVDSCCKPTQTARLNCAFADQLADYDTKEAHIVADVDTLFDTSIDISRAFIDHKNLESSQQSGFVEWLAVLCSLMFGDGPEWFTVLTRFRQF